MEIHGEPLSDPFNEGGVSELSGTIVTNTNGKFLRLLVKIIYSLQSLSLFSKQNMSLFFRISLKLNYLTQFDKVPIFSMDISI